MKRCSQHSSNLIPKGAAVPANRKSEVDAAVAAVDFEKNDYQIELDTSHGKITLNLLPDVAPGHCRNMIGLAKIGFYDGGVFHRVISGFMIQGGCPEGTGYGGPGYQIPAEFNATPHEPGVLSMARSQNPNSAGSQFFICVAKVPHLDRQYTAFGKTADKESLNVALKIGQLPTGANDRPKQPVTIKTVRVIEKPK
jgi:cyclophilin family peptidyl-prolyl cis-trans isomerase